MAHWSQNAQESANSSMSNRPADQPVQSCPIKGWEALAEIEDNPAWQTEIRVEETPPENHAAAAPSEAADPQADS